MAALEYRRQTPPPARARPPLGFRPMLGAPPLRTSGPLARPPPRSTLLWSSPRAVSLSTHTHTRTPTHTHLLFRRDVCASLTPSARNAAPHGTGEAERRRPAQALRACAFARRRPLQRQSLRSPEAALEARAAHETRRRADSGPPRGRPTLLRCGRNHEERPPSPNPRGRHPRPQTRFGLQPDRARRGRSRCRDASAGRPCKPRGTLHIANKTRGAERPRRAKHSDKRKRGEKRGEPQTPLTTGGGGMDNAALCQASTVWSPAATSNAVIHVSWNLRSCVATGRCGPVTKTIMPSVPLGRFALAWRQTMGPSSSWQVCYHKGSGHLKLL